MKVWLVEHLNSNEKYIFSNKSKAILFINNNCTVNEVGVEYSSDLFYIDTADKGEIKIEAYVVD